MKKIAVLILLIPGCTRQPEQEEMAWKQQTMGLANERVSAIVNQLKEDCDSTLIQMARKKADSLSKNKMGRPAIKRR